MRFTSFLSSNFRRDRSLLRASLRWSLLRMFRQKSCQYRCRLLLPDSRDREIEISSRRLATEIWRRRSWIQWKQCCLGKIGQSICAREGEWKERRGRRMGIRAGGRREGLWWEWEWRRKENKKKESESRDGSTEEFQCRWVGETSR